MSTFFNLPVSHYP